MRLVITGASGNLGSALFSQSCAAGHQVYGYSHTELDIVQREAVQSLFRTVKPEIVINCAAYTNVEKAESRVQQCREVNVVGAENLALICESLGVPLIQISTDYVFGESKGPHLETEVPMPLNVYGSSKYAGELAVQQCCSRVMIVRTGSLFGRQGKSFVKTILKFCREPYGHNSGKQDKVEQVCKLFVIADNLIMPTPSSALAKVLLQMAQAALKAAAEGDHSLWGVYHYAGVPAVSTADFAEAVIASAKEKGWLYSRPEIHRIRQKDYKSAVLRAHDLRLDCSKTCSTFNLTLPDWRSYLAEVTA
ncbi:MAG: dTDP-4-dehydrorhamnose reductase [Proteobacteria bacterium]|uniref:dTDP-4-dehydrorhamnose reductase n=1 Tax=Candidatus Avisuccinivibrio stercorigallinarum TaxID=2840704 RepID=A0A9D9DCZ6_9GAMM|nr:dTDP-4-dehydrorhamnose reductase [Candidatus Avisuccinivibrio stercorigallinarum]